MFDTIILLTDPVEKRALSTALLRHNPDLELCLAKSLDDLDAIDLRRLRRARLVSFASPVIVPHRILDHLGYGAYNFHPGPPSYPGWAPAYFAAYDRVTSFGVTAHVMYAEVDSGPIIALDLFDVPAAISAESLETMAYTHMTRQFFEIAKVLATSSDAPPLLPVQWCGRKNTRRDLAKLHNMPANISCKELDRQAAAFGEGGRAVVPALTLQGQPIRKIAVEPAPLAELANVAKTMEPAATPRRARR